MHSSRRKSHSPRWRPRRKCRPEPINIEIDLDRKLIRFNHQGDGVSWRDALGGGILVLADSGSGKSSAPLRTILASALVSRASVVIPTVKPQDAKRYAKIAKSFGYAPHVFRIGSDHFNPIGFAQRSGTAANLAENLTAAIMLPVHRLRREGGSGDAFWLADGARYVRHLVTIFNFAGVTISFRLINDALLNLPRSVEETRDPEWRKSSAVFEAIVEAKKRVFEQTDREDLEQSARFYLETIPTTPEKTRASTVATVCAALDPLVHGEVGATLNGDRSSLNPTALLDAPAILILDAPLQEWGRVGAIVQRLIISAIQQEILRRDVAASSHPVMLLIDEYQEFLEPEDDAKFMRTARDRRAFMTIASQCVGAIRDSCSAARDPKAAADMLLGLCGVKFFGATTDPETMRFASEVFSSTLQPRVSFGDNESSNDKAKGKGGRGRSTNISRDYQPDVPPIEFQKCRRGGPENGFIVEMFCSVSGRTWRSTRRPSIKVAFRQITD